MAGGDHDNSLVAEFVFFGGFEDFDLFFDGLRYDGGRSARFRALRDRFQAFGTAAVCLAVRFTADGGLIGQALSEFGGDLSFGFIPRCYWSRNKFSKISFIQDLRYNFYKNLFYLITQQNHNLV